MSFRIARLVLATIVISAFVISIAAIVYGDGTSQFFDSDFRSLIVMAIGQYAGPMSIIGAAYFATQNSRLKRRVGSSAAVAIVFTTLWCLFTAGRTLMFIASPDETTQSLLSWNTEIVPTTGFLIDGVLAYFFVASSKVEGLATGVASPENKSGLR